MGGNFAKRTRAAAGAGGPLEIAGQTVARGARAKIQLEIARLPSGTWATMPVIAIHGRKRGPSVWLSAAVHGDELNGVEIVRRVVASLDPAALTGTVFAVPIVNVFGVSAGSRYLPDRRDLNRSFPGSLRGSLASRLARLFFDNVASRCQLGIDFHTGSGGRMNLPQIRCDVDDARTRRYAMTFDAPVTLHANLRDGSLRAAARKENIRVLLYEAGEADRFDADAIEVGTAGALRVLTALKMIEGPVARRGKRVISRESRWLRAPRSGFCQLSVGLGETVRKNQVIARITDGTGVDITEMRSAGHGIVISLRRTALIHRGDALVHVAQPEA